MSFCEFYKVSYYESDSICYTINSSLGNPSSKRRKGDRYQSGEAKKRKKRLRLKKATHHYVEPS